MGLVITVLCIVLFIAFIISLYNRLIKLQNRVKEAWSDIDVQLKRRYDLIPNLVETVKGYASHESSTFEKVAKARNMAMESNATPENAHEYSKQENFLSSTLKSLFAVTENYPELKANINFLQMQRELVDIEDKLKASRRFYNSNVRAMNTSVEQFPSNLLAKFFGFSSYTFFEMSEADRETANVVHQVKF